MATRSRPGRRALAREEAKLARERARLAEVEPGGSPERPREVESPAQIDVIAERVECTTCGEAMRLDQHAAREVDGVTLRTADLTCVACGGKRTLWFRLAGTVLQ
ncbi:MAG: hypothetical protein KIT14_09240 [bacterium]|nr:hypothetical protein [bacterium]